MKERYMIVRIVNILTENDECNILTTTPCYQIVDQDYKTRYSAYKVKEMYKEPKNYIVVQYWI